MSFETATPEWVITPTDDSSDIQTTPKPENTNATGKSGLYYSWRMFSLYGILIFLMLVVFINLGLSLWLLSVMRFSKEGIGPIHIISGGIKLSGKALFADSLVASRIASSDGQPIRLESYTNFTIDTKDAEGNLDNRLFIGRNHFECQSSSMKITDRQGKTLFSSDPSEVFIGAEALSVGGEGGIIAEGSIQTPLIRAESGQDLRLESLTRSLEVHAPSSVVLESRAGSITANSHTDLKLESLAGAIQLDSSTIILHKLEIASALDAAVTRSNSKRRGEVYQLCSCDDGKLFLANPRVTCETYVNDYVCR